jgi:HAMP domain-containing protein
MPDPEPVAAEAKATARSPLAGCGILVVAVLVMVFLVSFSIYTLFRQFDEIKKFTLDTPVPVEVSTVEDRENEINDLAERLESFRQELQGEDETSLALDVDDLNLAIAVYAPLSELRSTFRVESITPEAMRIAISFRLNGKPRLAKSGEDGWVKYDPRFLNGTLVTRAQLHDQEVVLRVDEILVPGAEVPDGFTGQMSPYRPTQRYVTHSILGPAMARLTSVEMSDGKLVLRRVPGVVPESEITEEQVDSGVSRLFLFFGIGASVFLILVGAVLLIGFRAKGSRSKAA